MQAVWRWLWDAKHGVSKEDRRPLMTAFRSVLYAVSENDAEAHLEELLDSAEDYPNFVDYIKALWERREYWAMAWRKIACHRGHNTNNFAEVTVRLFKDNILTRCKAVAIVDFIVSLLERFYRNRLERFANGRVTVYELLLEKMMHDAPTSAKKTSEGISQKEEQSTSFRVRQTLKYCMKLTQRTQCLHVPSRNEWPVTRPGRRL